MGKTVFIYTFFMNHLLEKFSRHLAERQLLHINNRFLLAVSGGVDSMVLMELLRSQGFSFEVAHCNFTLRGEESDADEMLVRKYCEFNNLFLHVKAFDTKSFAQETNMNIQQAARTLRYEWFGHLMNSRDLQNIVTAHHANDNVETVLMNFFKGTGIAGLLGIKEKKGGIGGKVIRPLLPFFKAELLEFATSIHLEWREDASNESNKYARNHIRNEVVPSLKKIIPELEHNMMENINRFSGIGLIYEEAIRHTLQKIMEVKGNEFHMPVLKLMKTPSPSTVLYEIISRFGFHAHQLNDAMKLLHAESGKYIVSDTHRLIRNRNWLIMAPLAEAAEAMVVIEEGDAVVMFADKKLTLKKMADLPPISHDPAFAMLDASGIKFPLLLRKWKTGDYFYPLGMTKKKKLSRFFIDNKLSVTEKENIWVLESEKKIIWVVGMRIDNRFKLTPCSREAMILQLSSAQ